MMDSKPHLPPPYQKKVDRSISTPLLDGLLSDWDTTLPPLEKDRVTSQMADLLLELVSQREVGDGQD